MNLGSIKIAVLQFYFCVVVNWVHFVVDVLKKRS